VETVVEPTDARWAQLVDSSPNSLPFHRVEWQSVLEASYGFRPFIFAAAEPSGRLVAGLPVMEVRDPIRGRRWVSLPFTDRCHALHASDDAKETLAGALALTAEAQGIRRVEIRSRFGALGFEAGVVAVQHALDLRPGADALEQNFSSATRRNTKKARKGGLELRLAEEERDLTETFYELHVRTRRRLGVPVQPRRFFQLLWRLALVRGLGHVLLVLHRSRPIAGAVFLSESGTVVYKYGASDERSWSLRPNNLLFAEAIRSACDAGAQSFDFGRTDVADEGLRAFKAGWGAAEAPLVYTRTGSAPAVTAPSMPARAASATIRRSPAWVARALGQTLYRYAG
jgi:CelD/BcsL family acetyltransferase involved in cellulose biosynthesis